MNQNKLKSNFFWIGTIVNTHGLKGEIRLLSDINNIEEDLLPGTKVYYEKDSSINELEVKTMRVHKNFILLTFVGFDHINDIEWIKGSKLYCPKDLSNEDEVFESEMIGWKVVDEKFKEIGIIASFMDNGPYKSYVIENDGRSFNIPNVDEFIKDINKKQKTLLVNIPVEFIGEK